MVNLSSNFSIHWNIPFKTRFAFCRDPRLRRVVHLHLRELDDRRMSRLRRQERRMLGVRRPRLLHQLSDRNHIQSGNSRNPENSEIRRNRNRRSRVDRHLYDRRLRLQLRRHQRRFMFVLPSQRARKRFQRWIGVKGIFRRDEETDFHNFKECLEKKHWGLTRGNLMCHILPFLWFVSFT